MRRMLIAAVGLVAIIVLAGALSSPSSSNSTRVPTRATASVYSDDVLSRASTMTQQMSGNGPVSGHEYHAHATDEQLKLSQANPEFVRELEAYQYQIDRMLARTP